MREGNACRGLFFGTLIALPLYALGAWLVQLAWNALMHPYIAYWQALLGTMAVGAVTGALIAWQAMRKAR
jgi:hypothetical protein